jgi:hypothetical protein
METVINGEGARRLSLRWDDEFLRFRAVHFNKLMVEKWNEMPGEVRRMAIC